MRSARTPAAEDGKAVEAEQVDAAAEALPQAVGLEWAPALMPNLFLVGAAKAGTTSLDEYLRSQPEVFMSPLKEPHFFSELRIDSPAKYEFAHVVRERSSYERLFSDSAGFSYVGEASTSYLTNEAAPERIKRASPEAKIVVSLRDPVERAYSHFLYDVGEAAERRSFEEAVRAELSCPASQPWPANYLEYSDYVPGLRRYEHHFGRDSMHVIFFEELLSNPDSVLRNLLAFLGLDTRRARNLPHANPHGQPRGVLAKHLLQSIQLRLALRSIVPDPLLRLAHDRLLVKPASKPELDPTLRAKLISIYRPQVEEIASFVGRRPPWKNFGQSTFVSGFVPARAPGDTRTAEESK